MRADPVPPRRTTSTIPAEPDRGWERFDTGLHASVTRPGLATPFSIDVRAAEGTDLPAELTVRVSSAYLAMFDDKAMEPLPTRSFNAGEWTSWTFSVPPGRGTLTIDLDARLEPGVQRGRAGRAELDVEGTRRVAVEFRTWVMP